MKKTEQNNESINSLLPTINTPHITTNCIATDASLYDHVFDSTDDAYDMMIRQRTLDELLLRPLDKVSTREIENALELAMGDDRKRLLVLFKRRKTLDILDKGIKSLQDLPIPKFRS